MNSGHLVYSVAAPVRLACSAFDLPGLTAGKQRHKICFLPRDGTFAFFYVAMHFVSYAVIDQRLDLAAIVEDIIQRPYITIGMLALLMLIPLAVTSTKGMVRRLGRRWRQLHQLVYPIAILGVWHFYWQVKKDLTEPLIYCAILALLLGARIARQYRRQPQPS